MSNIETWDVNAAGNNDASPDGAPENMDRTGVNNSMREAMAAVARWYADPEYLLLAQGFTITRDSTTVVRIAGVDATGYATAGRRVLVTGGGNRFGTIVSSSFPDPDTTVVIKIDPNLGRDELASAINLTFNDVDPDTIDAASGTPFSSLVDDDVVRVEGSVSNDGSYNVDSASALQIVLAAAETLTQEGPVAARIYQESGIVPVGTNGIQFHHSKTALGAAFRVVGTGDGEVPSMSHLGPHVTKEEGPGGGLDSDTVDGKHASDIATQIAHYASNRIINGGFLRFQEGTAFAAADDEDYVADQWKLLTEDAANQVDVAQETSDVPTGALSALKITEQATDKKWALYQMVEFGDCVGMIGSVASLSFKAKITGASPASLRAALIVWTGAVDAPTPTDPISAWPSAPSDPSVPASYSIAGSGGFVPTSSWQTFKLENVTISGSANNVGVLIWSDDDTIAIGQVTILADVQLNPGDEAGDFRAEPASELIARTERFFCKTFDESDTPAHQVGGEGSLSIVSSGTAAGACSFPWRFPERMHTPPIVALYSPDGSGATGPVWNVDVAAEETGTTVEIGETGCRIENVSTVTDADRHIVHATADARFF